MWWSLTRIVDKCDRSTPGIISAGVAHVYAVELGPAAAGRLAPASTTSYVLVEPQFLCNPGGDVMMITAQTTAASAFTLR